MSDNFYADLFAFILGLIPYCLGCRLLWELIKYFKRKNKENK